MKYNFSYIDNNIECLVKDIFATALLISSNLAYSMMVIK